jgi:hypothetical protein
VAVLHVATPTRSKAILGIPKSMHTAALQSLQLIRSRPFLDKTIAYTAAECTYPPDWLCLRG